MRVQYICFLAGRWVRILKAIWLKILVTPHLGEYPLAHNSQTNNCYLSCHFYSLVESLITRALRLCEPLLMLASARAPIILQAGCAFLQCLAALRLVSRHLLGVLLWKKIDRRWSIEYSIVMRGKTPTKTQKKWWQILPLGMNCGLIGMSWAINVRSRLAPFLI